MSWLRVAICSVAGVVFHAAWYGPGLADATARGRNDFLPFYTAGRLAGTADLYSPRAFLAREARDVGYSTENLIFVRLPWQAAILWPIARLPYLPAYRLWEALAIGAIAASVLLFPFATLKEKVVVAAWSFPIFTSVAVGQDVPFILLALVCALRWDTKRERAAGVALALLVAKVHLLALFAAVFLRSKSRGQMAAFLTAGAVLVTLCFVGGGPDWMAAMRRALQFCEAHENLDVMPNFHRLFLHAPVIEASAAILMVGAVLSLAGKDRLLASAAAIATGLLIGRHSFIADCSFLLPAIGIVAWRLPQHRGLLSIFLLPLLYLAAFLGKPLLPTLALMAFVAGLAAAGHMRFSVRGWNIDHPGGATGSLNSVSLQWFRATDPGRKLRT